MLDFQEGYQYFVKNAGGYTGAILSDTYIRNIEKEIQKLANTLNMELGGKKTDVKQLKGNAAEFWHEGTFNINAAVRGSKNSAITLKSNGFASADENLRSGEVAGLKYYGTAKQTMEQQAKNAKWTYDEYKSAGGTDTFKQYLEKRGIVDPNASLYAGQIRLVPADQLREIEKLLKEKIAGEKLTRPENVKRYEETLAMISDRLKDRKGVESIPLDIASAKEVASVGKQCGVSKEFLEKMGISPEQLVQPQDVFRESVKAGIYAAALSIALKTAPEIYKTIAYLVETGEVDGEQLKSVGFSAVSGGAEGFLTGSVTAALTTVCKAGADTASRVTPELISSLVVLTMNSIHRGFDLAAGKTTKEMAVQDTMRDMFVSGCAYGGGVLGASIELYLIKEAYFGYMIGSFVGSVVGAFLYDKSRELALSFCVESGFTMFGLVEQDYSLPQEVWDSLGLASFDFESFETESVCSDTFEIDTFEVESFLPDSLGIKVLRRGVIGVSKIGYIV